MHSLTPWPWSSERGGHARLADDLATHGYSLFHDGDALEACSDAVAFCERLFGRRPVRFQRMLIEPSPFGNQRSLPKTMIAGHLHNDCAQLGLPPHVQVMVCERQAPVGGGTFIVDLWPILERLEQENPALLRELFEVPRAFPSGHLTRYGTTFSLNRGDLVCLHPTRAQGGRVGLAFQSCIDAVTPVAFKCAPGDVYVNNNHRCLHGREAFDDPRRRFVRLLFWFDGPLEAPARFVERAREASQRLSASLAEQPPVVRQLFGLDAAAAGPDAAQRARMLLQTLVQPTNCDDWQGPGQRLLLMQEAVLSALWNAACAPRCPPEQLAAALEQALAALGGEGPASH